MDAAEIFSLQSSETAFRVRKFAQGDPFGAFAAEIVVSDALRLLKKPLIKRVFERKRRVLLPTSRSLMRRVSVLFVASLLTANPVFRKRAVLEIKAVTRFSDWNPSHFLDVAEMAAAVSLGRVWFAGDMTALERAAVDEALAAFAIRPGREQFSRSEFWVDAHQNWNIVCCSGLILACTVAHGVPEQERNELLELASSAIRSGFSGFRPDGGYLEGPSYWELALRYSVLATLFQPSIELPEGVLKSWKFSKSLTCPSGVSVNYGDSTLRPKRSPFLGWLALKSGDADAAEWQRSAPGRPHPFDLVWPGPVVKATTCKTSHVVDFEDIGTVIRSSSKALPNAFVFLKRGSNSVNHAHLDLGSVLFEFGGQTFLCDLGREDYSREGYFGPDRFSYFRAKTKAHNTVSIGDADQSKNARARSLFSYMHENYAISAIEIESEGSGLRHRRGVLLFDDALWIRDELVPNQASVSGSSKLAGSAVWRVFTDAKVDQHGSGARLSKEDVSLECNLVLPKENQILLSPLEPAVAGSQKNGITCLHVNIELISEVTSIVVCFRRNSKKTEQELFAFKEITEWSNSEKLFVAHETGDSKRKGDKIARAS
ncbi:MAG: heparinase II/III family protein [Roseibium album]|uniref:heparinase II/III domain-containing protein n=1 Tax=Roseibium album TaxID=311410 RepID=UPI0032F066B1